MPTHPLGWKPPIPPPNGTDGSGKRTSVDKHRRLLLAEVSTLSCVCRVLVNRDHGL